jgi:hypothetical protein
VVSFIFVGVRNITVGYVPSFFERAVIDTLIEIGGDLTDSPIVQRSTETIVGVGAAYHFK